MGVFVLKPVLLQDYCTACVPFYKSLYSVRKATRSAFCSMNRLILPPLPHDMINVSAPVMIFWATAISHLHSLECLSLNASAVTINALDLLYCSVSRRQMRHKDFCTFVWTGLGTILCQSISYLYFLFSKQEKSLILFLCGGLF